MKKISRFDDIEELSHAVARLIVKLSMQAIEKRGRFTMALSGGKTPAVLYNLLAQLPYNRELQWKDIFIFWSDERCVPQDDERSNTNMAKKMLIDHIPIPAENVFPVQIQMKPLQSAIQYEQMMQAFFKEDLPSFDLILLGMGNDGHIASVFPDTNEERSMSLVKPVFKKNENIARITFTPLLINNARHIFLLVSGENKSAIIKEVLEIKKDRSKYPVQLIQPKKGKLEWFLDKAAASGLKNK